jgi:tetratricopeptide (TPR) repeat protein
MIIDHYENEGTWKECPVYAEAAECALKLGQKNVAEDYLKKDTYTNFVTGDTYLKLAGIYKGMNNLSKELMALQDYKKKFPGGAKLEKVNKDLFALYVESKNWEQAQEIWAELPDSVRADENLLEQYFTVNKALKKDEVCDDLAAELLKINENNITALEWQAVKYFWQAEKLYQTSLKDYNNNKTRKQYKILLNALDVVTADFKKSLELFKRLYALDPQPEYARYLGNIYNRLDDKKKADFYYEQAK